MGRDLSNVFQPVFWVVGVHLRFPTAILYARGSGEKHFPPGFGVGDPKKKKAAKPYLKK